MSVLARLAAAACAAAPALALGEEAAAPVGREHGWIWMLAAAVVALALFRLFFAGTDRRPGAGP